VSSDYNLGTAKGVIALTYDDTGVKSATKSLDGLDAQSKKTKDGLNKVATGAGAAAAILGGGLALAANKAIDFQKQVSAIGAVSGATTEQIEKLRAKALQLGADTAFSASEAANAMEELAKAGVPLEDILNGAADATVALAAAGGISLPEAATIAANAMNVFNLSARDLGHVADLIAGAANASAIDVSEFGFSLQQAGAVANLVGVSFDDLSTAIALMGNAGIKGSDAGTSLKTALANLQPVTKKEINLFKELGLITADGSNKFFDQTGKLKSLAQVSQILQDALKGQTAEQKAMNLQLLFGSDAIRAAAILSDAGAEGFNKLADSIGKVKAADVAKARLDNVAGSIEQLKGSAETAAITIGSTLLPVIRKITDTITKLTNAFSGLSPGFQKVLAGVLVVVAGFLVLIALVAKVGAVFIGFGAIASAGALPIIGIVLAIIAALALLVIGIKYAYEHSQKFRDVVATAFEAVRKVIGRVVDGFKAFQEFFNQKIIPIIKVAANILTTLFKPALQAVQEFLKDHIIPNLKKLQEVFIKILPALKILGIVLAVVIIAPLVILLAVLALVIIIVLKLAGIIIDVVVWAVSKLVDAIVWLISHLDDAWHWLQNFAKGVSDAYDSMVNSLADAFTAVGNWFVWLWGKITEIWNAIISFISGVVDKIVAAFWRIVDGVVGLVLGIKQKLDEAISFVKSIPGRIGEILGGLGSYLYNSGKALIQGFIDGMLAMVGRAKDAGSKLLGEVRKLWPFSPAKEGPFSGRGWTKYSGMALVEDFSAGITVSGDDAVSAAAAMMQRLADTLPGGNAPAVNAAVSGTALATTTAAANTTTNNAGAMSSVIINDLNLKGVWDFTDPGAARKVVADLHTALDDYARSYR